jgi:hypothetical protein
VRDQGQEPQTPAATRAGEDVHAKGPLHQLRPEVGARPAWGSASRGSGGAAHSLFADPAHATTAARKVARGASTP